MNISSSGKEKLETDIIEDFLAALMGRNLHTGIIGYKKLSEEGQDVVINTGQGDILLQVSQIADMDFAFPISRADYNSGRYSHFISKPSEEIPWAVDLDLRDTSIQRSIQMKLQEHDAKSDHRDCWLLVFSTSGYPEIECCVRGNTKDSDAVSIARAYLNKYGRIPFDQIWYTNLVTFPVRIWPYRSGQIC
ncbi:MAG: hypothetical protein QNK29_01265 [Desulfobacterales bacterium]|nr:hypothetical protein [Desulfobacterales bacterium]MDX2510648.1 hypothetical protein [Desulfobacterales bacterium]